MLPRMFFNGEENLDALLADGTPASCAVSPHVALQNPLRSSELKTIRSRLSMPSFPKEILSSVAH